MLENDATFTFSFNRVLHYSTRSCTVCTPLLLSVRLYRERSNYCVQYPGETKLSKAFSPAEVQSGAKKVLCSEYGDADMVEVASSVEQRLSAGAADPGK